MGEEYREQIFKVFCRGRSLKGNELGIDPFEVKVTLKSVESQLL